MQIHKGGSHKLTTKQRNSIPTKYFGYPKDRAFPLNDEEHVKAALMNLPRSNYNKKTKDYIRKRIIKRAKDLGMTPQNIVKK